MTQAKFTSARSLRQDPGSNEARRKKRPCTTIPTADYIPKFDKSIMYHSTDMAWTRLTRSKIKVTIAPLDVHLMKNSPDQHVHFQCRVMSMHELHVKGHFTKVKGQIRNKTVPCITILLDDQGYEI